MTDQTQTKDKGDENNKFDWLVESNKVSIINSPPRDNIDITMRQQSSSPTPIINSPPIFNNSTTLSPIRKEDEMQIEFKTILTEILNMPDDIISILKEEGITDITMLWCLEASDLMRFGLSTLQTRKCIVLQNYVNREGRFPSISTTFTQLVDYNTNANQQAAAATVPTLQTHMYPPSTIPSSIDFDTATPVLSIKDSKTVDIPNFSGQWKDWRKWYMTTRNVLGNNRWLHVAEEKGPIPKAHLNINNSLYYNLAKATTSSSVSQIVIKFEPKPGEALHANGRGAWQALVKHYMNSTNVDTMTNSIVSELDNLHVTKSGS
ncbi:MAG: hypothetical protein ACREBR_01435, partial [bacterium]